MAGKSDPKKTNEVEILGKHITAVQGVNDVLAAMFQKHANSPFAHGSPAAHSAFATGDAAPHAAAFALASAAQPPRPTVVATVCDALRTAQIMENAKEDTFLTDRFNQVDAEDTHMGKPHFRINIFIKILHLRLPGNWGIAPSELLSGVLTTPGEIADRIIATS